MANGAVALLERRPRLAVFTGLLLLASSAAGLARVELDFTYRSFFHRDDPLVTTFEDFERRFGNDDAVLLAIHSPSGIFDADSIGLLREATARMWRVPEILRVDSLVNYPWVHAEGDDIFIEPFFPDDAPLTTGFLEDRRRVALSHETLPGYLVSADGRTALVYGRVRPAHPTEPDANAITGAVREMARELARTDHELHVAGLPVMVTSFEEISAKDNARVIPVALLACAAILMLLLRSWTAVAASMLVVVASASSAVGLAGWLSVEINAITGALPQILIAIAVADSVHVLATFARARGWAESSRVAARHALVKNFVPTILTSVTTTAGFLSFAASPIRPIAGLGLVAGLATGATWLFTYLFVGGLLFLLPFPPRPLAERNGAPRALRISRLLARRRRPILAVFSGLALVAAFLFTKNHVDADPVEYFAESHPLRVAFEHISRRVGAGRSVEVVIESGRPGGAKDPDLLARVDELERWIEELPEVRRAVSILDDLKRTHRALHGDLPEHYVLAEDRATIGQELLLYTMSLPEGADVNHQITMDHGALRLTVLWAVGSSSEALGAIERIEAKARELGLDATTTGKYQLFQRLEGYVVDSFLSSVSLALVLVSGILMLAVRSARLGAIALVANVIPLVLGGALLWLLGESLNIGTVLVISVCLGIAVDDTVHVLTEFQGAARRGCGAVEAVGEILAETVPTLLATSAVLVATFGAFVLSSFTPYQVFGVMTASILCAAFVTDVVFLPALLLAAPSPRASSLEETAPAAEKAMATGG